MTRRISQEATVTSSSMTYNTTGQIFDATRARTVSAQAIITVDTPSAKTFADADVATSTDIITIASHGFSTGLKVAATTSGVLPGGLSATNYYIIVVSSSTIKLASSLVNAQAGTAVDITSAAGGGTHTLTPASLASATVHFEKSNDYDPIYNTTGTWSDVDTPTTVSASGTYWLSVSDPSYKYIRLRYAIAAGRMSSVAYVITKEDL